MPVAIARLRDLIALAGEPGVESIDLVEDGTRIVIRRNGAATPVARSRTPEVATAAPPVAVGTLPDPDSLLSPMFGMLHLTPAPGARPFVTVGERIEKGRQLCLIEAMKLFSPLVSDRAGRIEAVLAEAGSEVAVGQPLFRIVPA